MHLRTSVGATVLLGAVLALVAGAWPCLAADSAPQAAFPSDQEVERAVEQLSKDPNLSEERTIRTLSFGRDEADESTRKERNSFFDWIANLFGWLASGARWLTWVVIGVLVLVLVVYLVRLFTERRSWTSAARALAPTHVQDLDIRPESLPEDVGAAARALWDRGERRAALSLLYRGLLSRLVHVHEVEIRASSTEGDCVELAARRLTIERLDYVSRLIRVWQRAVYGGVEPSDDTVHMLCAEFAFALEVVKVAPPANATAAEAT